MSHYFLNASVVCEELNLSGEIEEDVNVAVVVDVIFAATTLAFVVFAATTLAFEFIVPDILRNLPLNRLYFALHVLHAEEQPSVWPEIVLLDHALQRDEFVNRVVNARIRQVRRVVSGVKIDNEGAAANRCEVLAHSIAIGRLPGPRWSDDNLSVAWHLSCLWNVGACGITRAYRGENEGVAVKCGA